MDIYKKAKDLYENNSTDFLTSPYKMGICMATFQRKNGKSPEYLTKSLKSILAQTSNNWHIYLVGDKYEDNNEFNILASLVPSDKITAINLPVALERENLTGENLWMQGGANALNTANRLALDDNCDYILHLDDDDSFHPKKIQILNYILTIFKDPIFLFHLSTHADKSVLPREAISNTSIEKNIVPVSPANIIHSSFCIHKSILNNFKYSSYISGKTDYIPGDMEFINYLNKSLEDTSKYTIFIPLLLSYHDMEGETKKGGKRYKSKKKNSKSKNKTKRSKKKRMYKKYGGSNSNVYIYTFCYNESVLLPHMVNHYKKNFPNSEITIYDNYSTDNSVELAKSLGCKVIPFDTNNELSCEKGLEIRNNCWKEKTNSWIIMCDMDEFLCLSENDLNTEYKNGTTIIKSKGYNIIGNSNFEDLHDINIETVSKGVYDPMYDKKICFYTGSIIEMNYTVGAHTINPKGTIKYSDKEYLLKHINWPGLPYKLKRNKILFNRSTADRNKGMGSHYKDKNSEIENEYNNYLTKAEDIKLLYPDCFNEL
jgi:glycosyltransferase involved in cell wall biosynthesis